MDEIRVAAPRQPISMHRLWQILRKRKATILTTIAICLLGAGVWLLFPATYKSTGTVQVRPASSDTYRVAQVAAEALGNDSDELIESTTYTLQAQTLLLRVASELKLQNRKEFLPKALVGRPLTDPETRDILYRNLNKSIEVEHVPKTEMISISCKTDDPALSAQIINSLVSNYITWLYETRYSSSQRAADWLKGQLDTMYQQIESDQKKVIALQSDLGFVGDGSTTNLNVASLQGLLTAARDAEVNRLISEARYQNLQSGPSNVAEGGFDLITPINAPRTPSNLLATLRGQSAAADAQYAKLSSELGSNHPDVKQAKAQAEELHKEVASEQGRLVDQAKESLSAAKTFEDQSMSALNRQEDILHSKGDKLLDYEILQYNQAMHRQLYQELIQHLRESTITSGLDAAEVDIVDIADTPYLPWPFGWSTALVAAGVVGLFLGIVLAFVQNSLDQRFSSVEEVEEAVGNAAWAVCPVIHRKPVRKSDKPGPEAKVEAGATQLEFIKHPNSQFSEAVRVLRTSLLLLGADKSIKTIMVTSSTPGEGKSTISANLAACLMGGGDRTVLVECDLRRPTFALRLLTPDRVGLSTVLSGVSTLEEAMVHSEEMHGLDILGSGPIPPLPAELLGSVAMQNLLKRLQAEYRFVVIDVPPALMLSDAFVLANYCDAIAIVARMGLVNRGILLRTIKAIRQKSRVPCGVVVNAVDHNIAGYYGYYDDYGYSSYVSDK
jgi:capsular exopolysaccharide synthesis family protein